MLHFQHLVAPESIESAMLRGGHQPGARVRWYALNGPDLERSHECIACQLFREPDVMSHASDCGDEARGLVLPHSLNRFRYTVHALKSTG